MNVSLDQLSTFGREVFRQAGLSQADAATATDTVLAADSWGIHTHGLKNLGGYVKRLNAGGINPLGQARVTAEGPAWARVDGDAWCSMTLPRARWPVGRFSQQQRWGNPSQKVGSLTSRVGPAPIRKPSRLSRL